MRKHSPELNKLVYPRRNIKAFDSSIDQIGDFSEEIIRKYR